MMYLSSVFAHRYNVMVEGNAFVEVMKRIIPSFLELSGTVTQLCFDISNMLRSEICKHVCNVFLNLDNFMCLVIILMIFTICNFA
jgi:hypothetical protein